MVSSTLLRASAQVERRAGHRGRQESHQPRVQRRATAWAAAPASLRRLAAAARGRLRDEARATARARLADSLRGSRPVLRPRAAGSAASPAMPRRKMWRPAGEPYPMPPVPVSRRGRRSRADSPRSARTVAPLPLAVNTTVLQRPRALHLGWLVRCGMPHRRARESARPSILPRAFAARAPRSLPTPPSLVC